MILTYELYTQSFYGLIILIHWLKAYVLVNS